MVSVSMEEMLKLARGKVRYMPETVYAFVKYLILKLEGATTPEGFVDAISLSLDEIRDGEVEKLLLLSDEVRERCRSGLNREFLEYIAANKDEVLRDARFVLQVIDDLAENAKFLTGKTGEKSEKDVFVDKVRDLCKERFGWKPVRRAKVYDRQLFHTVYDPNVIAAVEWWTTLVQLSDEEEPTDGERWFIGFDTEEMFRFRDELAQQITRSLEHNGFAVFTTRGGPDHLLTRVFDRLECEPRNISDNIVMCVFENRVEVTMGDYIDYKCIWEKEE